MKKIFPALALLCALMLPNSCKRELAREDNGAGSTADTPAYIVRSLVDHSFTPEFQGQTKVSVTETVSGTGLKLTPSWNESGAEEISVYILKDNGVFYAGDMVSDGPEAEGGRTFSGEICAKEEGERYAYVYPSLKDSEFKESEQTVVGHAAQGTIDWTVQNGSLATLAEKMPFIWREKEDFTGVDFIQPFYVLKLVLKFQSAQQASLAAETDNITLSTMSRGNSDNVFPKKFKAANLAAEFNSSLADWTEGTACSEDNYASELKVNSWAAGSNDKEKIAYIVCSSAHNLNVFSSKFRITAKVGENTFYSEFRSFPGQESAQEERHLNAFADGKIYRATRNMSPVPPATLISTAFGGVSSLLGMWNEYGKPYDPDQRIIAADGMTESNVPSQLFELLGNSSKQSAFNAQMDKDHTSSGGNNTPNFLGRLYNSPGNSTNAGKTIKVTADSKVFVTIISENAWDRNLLGYYHFPFKTDDEHSQPDDAQKFHKYIVYPDISRGGHVPFNQGGGSGNTSNPPNIGSADKAPLKPYSTVQLLYTDENGFTSETFPEGTFIGFFVMKEAIKNSVGSLLNWGASKLYTNYGLSDLNPAVNPFAAGDIVRTSVSSYNHESREKGLAIFGFRDNANDNNNYAFATMIYMVSTSDPDALDMQNTAAFNIGATDGSNLVVGRTGSKLVTKNLSSGITCSNPDNEVNATTLSYETTLSIDDPLYGSFAEAPVVMHGSTKIDPVSFTETSYTYQITNVQSNISISAKTKSVVKVKALTYNDLNSLAAPSGTGEGNYSLILHCTNNNYSSTPTDGAFNFTNDGLKSTVPFSKSPFWSFDAQIANSVTALDINPLGKYGEMFWTLEKKEGGFVLKNTFGNYLWRSTSTWPGSSWPLVSTTQEPASATLLTAENAGNNGYDIFLKAKNESSLNYMTSRVGYSESGDSPKPIFNSGGSHVNTYGKWRVYKVWTEQRQ